MSNIKNNNFMKNIPNILLSVCISCFALSCEKQTASDPKAAIEVNKTMLTINESMEIHFTGEAEQVVIFTGDETHNYDLREQSNTGFVVNKGLFTYAYTLPGTYRVVCVASAYTDGAKDLKRDTCSFAVSVIDDETEIERLSCPQILYDEVFAERLPDDEWIMRLPRKVKYNTSTQTMSLQQRLRFYIQSDSTAIFVNAVKYSETVKYDLSSSADILVKSNFGTERHYKLHTLYYPEFETFKLAGVEGTLVRNQFDYSTFDLEITLPPSTDVSNIAPEFSLLSASEKAFIDEAEQTSGVSAVDFTKDIVYRLVSALPENQEIKAVSTVNVKIKF
jgi:hypothetical protein